MHLHAAGQGFGYLGAALGVAMVVPQILRTLRDRSVPGVSALSWSLMALACTSWLLYGVRTTELPQIPGNVLLVSGAVVIAFAAPSRVPVRIRAVGLVAAGAVLVLLAVLAPSSVIGAVAISIGLVSTVPQTFKSLARRGAAVSAVAPLSWLLRIASQSCWLIYAIAVGDVTVTISAIVLLLNATIVLGAESLRRPAPVAMPELVEVCA
jgi:uncharacterized protein with PQ loop repeat